MTVRFPEGFLWGAATSAHQVEGGNTANDWWRFEQEGGGKGPSGDACDQYHRYESDFDLVVELGHTAHRLSIEWSRIEPREGEFAEEQIEHYVAVLKALKARGLVTYVTLHHFTNPLWFADAGGWHSPEAPSRFERYVDRIAPEIAAYVDFWTTINEPTSVAAQGYLFGAWPPLKRWDLRGANRLLDSMALAHRRAAGAIKRHVPDAQVGFSNICMHWRPLRSSSAYQKWLAGVLGAWSNHRFADAVVDTCDYLGVQYYNTLNVGWRPYAPGHIPGTARTDVGWDIDPDGLRVVVSDYWERYGLPIHVTENGLADALDSRREVFIREHLAALAQAIDAGADVRAYLHWSLLDNFEWALGYAPRFGLVEVDYDTQARTPRASAYAYRQIIADNGFEEAR